MHKRVKMAACRENFLCEYYFDAVLVIFFSHGYGENTSESVEEMKR